MMTEYLSAQEREQQNHAETSDLSDQNREESGGLNKTPYCKEIVQEAGGLLSLSLKREGSRCLE